MANMYLVDYENVGDSAVMGIKNLVPGERVVIFFSKNAKALTFELWNEMTECKAITSSGQYPHCTGEKHHLPLP